MKLVLCSRRSCAILLVGAGTLGSVVVGTSSAATESGGATGTPQRTVTGSLITRRPGTLKPGSKVRSADLGQRVFTDARHGFALANTGQAQYPAATTDGGKTWRTDGPALHLDAAQAPLSVTHLGAAGVRTIYAYGGGQVIDTTRDGGKHWYRALFNGLVMAVVPGSVGRLVAFVDGSSGNTGVTWQYVSRNGGRSWGYDAKVGGA